MKQQAIRLIGAAFRLIPLSALPIFCVGSVLAQTSGGSPGTTPRSSGSVSHTIRGKIFLPSGGLPEQRIRVVLELTSGGIAGETFSDSVGNFEFRSLPSNTYKVTVPSDNRVYDTSIETVELFGNFSRTFTVQIYLKDKSNEFARTSKEKVLSIADQQEVPKSAKKAYEKGVKLAQEKKLEEAIKQFEGAIKEFPQYLLALNKMGEQYLSMQKLTEARTAFERAIEVNPKFALPHVNLGIIHFIQKQYPEAIAKFEAGNHLDDSFPVAHLNLGLALMSNDPPDFDRAEREMTRALDLGGKSFAQIRLHLFNLNVRRKKIDKAAEQLEAYLKEAPNAPDADAVRERLTTLKKALAQQKESVKQ